jgi:hypothetical protein
MDTVSAFTFFRDLHKVNGSVARCPELPRVISLRRHLPLHRRLGELKPGNQGPLGVVYRFDAQSSDQLDHDRDPWKCSIRSGMLDL